MRELRYVHRDYETRGPNPQYFEAAHRITRMAFSVGGIIDVPIELYAEGLDALERLDQDAESPAFTPTECATLAALFGGIAKRLDEALDAHNRPQSPYGDAIVEEAQRPLVLDDGSTDDDRVFQLEADGSVGTVYPRMSLTTFRERVQQLAAFLRRAADEGLDVAVLG